MRNVEIKVLDFGFVRLVDVMGNDSSIVQAARVSTGQGIKTPKEDENLIRHLMRNRHTSPFEMVEFKFHCKMPIFVARQWIRHRTANVNEYSGRYSEMKDECYIPKNLMGQDTLNKQGSMGKIESDTEMTLLRDMKYEQKESFKNYHNYLNNGISKEISRINLPLSTYTEWYWKIDLHNLLHFLKLRLDSHAQFEIRVYAEAIRDIIKEIVPVTWNAFENYQLNSVIFSKEEMNILKKYINVDINDGDLETLSKTEKSEFKNKLNFFK